MSHIAVVRCSGVVSAKIEGNRLTGTSTVHMTNLELTGIVASDGSFSGLFGPYSMTGKFDRSSFKGSIPLRNMPYCSAYWDITLDRQP
jgi:hypothetical protein